MTNKDLVCEWCRNSDSNYSFLVLEFNRDKMTKRPKFCPGCGKELRHGLEWGR